MKKAVTTIVCMCLFLCVVYVQPIKAQYQDNITINADGSISPSTAPIQQDKDVYMLTDDVIGDISVMASNITFDGNGHSIIGELSVGLNYSSPPILTGASNVTVKNLIVKNSVFGISLHKTSNSMVINNTILRTGPMVLNIPIAQPTGGIYVVGGGSNIITENNLANSYVGIYFAESQNNLIVRNSVVNCSNPFLLGGMAAIVFWGASNNTIYHNNFINNPMQAYDGSFSPSPFSVNTWDNGYPSGGNYWSDYHTKYPNATEISDSGIGNTPYVIDSQNKDQYPLMEPFTTTAPKISISAPVNQIFNETSVHLNFIVDKQVNWIGYSLDGKDNVTITGNTTIAGLSNGFHTLVVYANDTFGNMGASETVTFTVAVPEPFPVIPVAAASSAVAIAGGLGVLIYFKKRKHQPTA
jgi:parallel beta-helix repeat protein